MRGTLAGLAALGLCVAAAAADSDDTVALEGKFIQGGLAGGRAPTGARVEIDGRPVRVAADGRFIVGFGRDHPAAAKLRVVRADGRVETRALAIEKRRYDVQRIDGLPPAQVTPDPETLKRIEAERDRMRAARGRDLAGLLFGNRFDWPAIGRISGIYGSQRILNGQPRAPHLGLDIAAPTGTEIRAPADGTVALAEDDLFFTGKTVVLDHGHGLTTTYAHMSALAVATGDRVARGQPIGRIGATGRVTGAHLHWGVHWRGVGLDPALLVGPMPAEKAAKTGRDPAPSGN